MQRESLLCTEVTSANFGTEGKVVQFIDMFTMFMKKGENK